MNKERINDVKFFKENKFLFKKNIINKNQINLINKQINKLMSSHMKKRTSNNSELFSLISKKSFLLRSNLYKCFSKLVSNLEILSNTKIKNYLRILEFKNYVIGGYSITIMEPNRKKYLFPLHQDLKNRLSKKSLQLWIPLNDCTDYSLGGLELYGKSDKYGPLRHSINQNGLMEINKNEFNKISKLKKYSIDKYKTGDVLFFSPYICHKSIMNKNKKISRWTLHIQVEDLTNSKHLQTKLSPFKIENYTNNLSNEVLRNSLKNKKFK